MARALLAVVAVCVLVSGCGDAAEEQTADAEGCSPAWGPVACVGGDLLAVDSCGTLGTLVESCAGSCFAGVCETAASGCGSSALNTCEMCISVYPCGWADGRCVVGNEAGPAEGTAESWHYVGCSGAPPAAPNASVLSDPPVELSIPLVRYESGKVRAFGGGWGTVAADGTAESMPIEGERRFRSVAVAGVRACGLTEGGDEIACWQAPDPAPALTFSTMGRLTEITIALVGTLCGITEEREVVCADLPLAGRAPGPPQTIVDESGQPLRRVVKVTGGGNHACALERSGDVYCWYLGSFVFPVNFYGVVGNGRFAPPHDWVAARAAISNVVDVSAATHSTCAVRTDGSVFCWGVAVGRNAPIEERSYSDSDHAIHRVPAFVPGIRGAVAITVAGAGWGNGPTGRACAIWADASVACWGDNTAWLAPLSGALGLPGVARAEEAQPLPALDGARQVAFDTSRSCAIDGGELYCWGTHGAHVFESPTRFTLR